jgi:N-acyl-D-amino-acid deacylase
VADSTTPERPDAPPSGIRVVMVGGQVVARDGRLMKDGRHGVVLRW